MEHHLTVPRTARYQQLGELGPGTRRMWLVLHGYGQLAAYFVRHFAPLHAADPAGTVIVAPEGLSRFYLQGNGGRVGASWMTKDDRLHEIADYVAYLNQLSAHVQAAAPQAQLVVLGFSQGTATASRWLAQAAVRPARLVLWAGAFPEDMDFALAQPLLSQTPVTVVAGTRDEFISEEKFAQHLGLLRALGCKPEVVRFDGGHVIDSAALRQLTISN